MTDPKVIANDLLNIRAVFLRPDDPFTWASGIKSPIYCDNRLVLSHPEVRSRVEQGLAEIIQAEYSECTLVAGTSTAGIAHAAIVADRLGLPMCYVRGTAKEHGRNNQIEGSAPASSKTVVVEDLISTAGSVIDVAETLRAAGCEVLGIVSIFTYGLQDGLDKLQEHNLKNVSLLTYDVLIQEAVPTGYVREEDLPKLRAFRANPREKDWMNL